MRITPNDDVKADSASLFRPAELLGVAFKAADSTEILKRTQQTAPVLTRITSVVIASTFCCSLNHLIRAKIRHNTINRDTTHVNNSNYVCLLSRHELANISTIAADMQIVAGLRRALYWEQLLNISFILTRTCKKKLLVTRHG